MSDKYILNEYGEPRREPDVMAWARWFGQDERRIVGLNEIGPYTVSTVFLGLDHSFRENGPPVLWETMVFLKKGEDYRQFAEMEMNRCAGGREQAEKMHEDMVERVQAISALTGGIAIDE